MVHNYCNRWRVKALVMYIWFGLQSTVWLGHDTITTMDSLVVKGLT